MAQLRAKERSLKEFTLMKQQLEPLPADTRMFKSNGKASSSHNLCVVEMSCRYFLAPKDEILAGLDKASGNCERDIEGLKAGQKKLQKELEAHKQN